MPSREQTVADASQIFENAEYPSGLAPVTAWLGIYQTLLWHEQVDWVGYDKLPHIVEADKLRPSSPNSRRKWTKPTAWQRRACALGIYLANQLSCPLINLPDKTDLLMKRPAYEGMQRQNSLGIAFAGLIGHVLEKFGSQKIFYETEVDATTLFPNIRVPGRSITPRIDVLAQRDNIPRAVISTKWSLRHDRLSDLTNECPVYKAEYMRTYRQARRDQLLCFVVTNEYDPSRLSKILSDSCVDAVVHVHKPAVVDVCRLNGRLTRLIDLEDFITLSSSW